MFSLCLIKIKIAKNQQKIICDSGASKLDETAIEEKIAMIEATEEMRNKLKDMIQKQPAKKPTETSSANKTAIAVATPLPPLKLR